MATAHHTTDDCKECGSPINDFYTPGYCSEECYFRERGESVIRQIQNDHTYCTTCYGQIKTVDAPPQEFIDKLKVHNGYESSQSVIGFQDHTPRVERDAGFIYCKCGNIDHYTQSEILREIDLTDVITNLWDLLLDYYDKDQFGDNSPDKEILLDTLKESNMDFELSIGKAVYSKH